jgi:hypothetical protein
MIAVPIAIGSGLRIAVSIAIGSGLRIADADVRYEM